MTARAGSFEALVLGAGDAFSALHRPSALLLSCDGFRLAVDCPDSYRAVLREASARAGLGVALEDVDAFLVTHLHGDHVNGLEGVAFHRRLVEGRRVRLVTSPEVRAEIWDGRLRAAMGTLWDGRRHVPMTFDDYFEHVPLAWDGETVVGPFHIRARRTIHHLPTSALVVSAGGRTLGYSSDTAFDRDLLDFLAQADLVVHETNFGPAHTPYEELAALPAALRARMRLIHAPDGLDPAESAISVLRQGDVLVP